MPEPTASFDRECAALCRQVFRCEPSEAWMAAYRDAQAVVFGAASGAASAALERPLREGWDLEALELAWRRQDKSNPLTKKLNSLFYIVECSREGFPHFVSTGDGRLKAWAALSAQTLRSLYKLVHGRRLLARLEGRR